MTLRDLLLRLRSLLSPRRVERELDEELAFHLEQETAKLVANGIDVAEARHLARVRFGSVPLAADQCRDARGTSFITGLIRDLTYAFRLCIRAPLTSLTIVATVAVGLALVTVVFTFFNSVALRVDDVRNPYELFGVVRATSAGASSWTPFTRSEFDALRRETNTFTEAVAMVRDVTIRIDGRQATMTFVTGNFFHLLGVTPALGRIPWQVDDERSNNLPTVVLSHKGWTKFFPDDRTAVGQTLPINGAPYEVAGVMPESFRGLSVSAPDGWVSLELVGRFRQELAGREQDARLDDVVGRLKPGVSLESARAALDAWIKARLDPSKQARMVTELRPSLGTVSANTLEALLWFAPIFVAFGLILLIGCSNVANLLLARGLARQKEIGIRLSLGASRSRIVRQLLTESFLLAVVSALCGLMLSRLMMTAAVYAVSSTLPREIAEQVDLAAPAIDWRVSIFLLFGAAMSTVLFGLAPALQSTRLEIVRTMRGDFRSEGRPRRARHALIALQVGASALLLIAAGMFLQSTIATAKQRPSIRTADTLRLKVTNELKRSQILDVLKLDPMVSDVASSSEHQALQASAISQPDVAASTPVNSATSALADSSRVSPNYFHVFDIEMLKGRSFTDDERRSGASVAVISNTLARRLWSDGDAVGKAMRLEGQRSRTVTVVGIIRTPGPSYHFVQFFSFSDVYLPTSLDEAGTSFSLRVHGDPDQVRISLLDRLTRVDPGLGTLSTMRTLARGETYILELATAVTLALGGLALLLTVTGLFSVLSSVVEQRRKELGVRIALGATKRDVLKLVFWQMSRPVAFGLVAGGGFAALLAIVLVATPGVSYVGHVIHVLDPVAYIAGATVIIGSCALAALIPALRATQIDPIRMLRGKLNEHVRESIFAPTNGPLEMQQPLTKHTRLNAAHVELLAVL